MTYLGCQKQSCVCCVLLGRRYDGLQAVVADFIGSLAGISQETSSTEKNFFNFILMKKKTALCKVFFKWISHTT